MSESLLASLTARPIWYGTWRVGLNSDVHLVAVAVVVDISVLGSWHDPRIAPFP